ncbi:MAG: lytic transglycosylase domain-containing protein [Nitrospirae bacterium]|nr:lytic transglycosylase domain-containing protein [Nitrospirota bacterium]
MRKYLFLLPFAISLLPFASVGAEQNIHEIVSDAQYKAAVRFQVPVELLNAIKQVESGGHPWALCVNLGNGKSMPIFPRTYYEAVQYLTRSSSDNIDIGPWQVNYHYIGKRLGVTKVQMLDPYISSLLAAYKLSSEIATNGYTWHAVGNYHSYNLPRKIKYVASVKRQLAKDGYKVN